MEARWRCLDLTLAAMALSSPCRQQGHGDEVGESDGDAEEVGEMGLGDSDGEQLKGWEQGWAWGRGWAEDRGGDGGWGTWKGWGKGLK